MELFGLLHLSPGQTSAMNATVSSFEDQALLYWRNAKLLARSLEAQGLRFSLLTNHREQLKQIAGDLEDVHVIEVPFTTDVPGGLPFYSAHFKVDAYRFLGRCDADYIVFCDLDAVCINPPPLAVARAIANRVPLVYDVSDQLRPAIGAAGLIEDVDVVAGRRTEGRWLGGEFVAGPPDFFADLTRSIEAVLPAYFANTQRLNSLNDETYLSAAVALMRGDGYMIGDAGPLAAVGRFWSVQTKHIQHDLGYFREHFLLHLPADKNYLASIEGSSRPGFDTGRFWADYEHRLGQMRTRRPRTVRSVLRAIARRCRESFR